MRPLPPPVSPLSHGRLSSAYRRIFQAAKTSLALVGLAVILPVAYDAYKSSKDEEEKKKKGVLVLPFYRMKIVERRRPNPLELVSLFVRDDPNRPIEIEVRELVDLIHSAATDPNVVALYGNFGNGMDSGLKVEGLGKLT